jgi:hypothetical protein
MALLHATAGTALAKAAVYDPTGLTTTKIIVIALLVGAAALWSAIDGWRCAVKAAGRTADTRGRPRGLVREDLGRTWVIAALISGPVSGILSVIGRAAFVDQSGTSELWPALSGGAAFTALLVLIPAGLGMFAGGRLHPAHKAARGREPRSAGE